MIKDLILIGCIIIASFIFKISTPPAKNNNLFDPQMMFILLCLAIIIIHKIFYIKKFNKVNLSNKEGFQSGDSGASDLANELLNFTDEQWQETSKYHNLDNPIYKILSLEEDIVMDNLLQSTNIIEINGTHLQNSDMELFNHLHLIIESYDEGEYSFGNIKITIKDKTPLNNIIVNNPPFNMDLLKIE